LKVLYISHEAQLNGAPKSLLEYVIKIKDKGVTPIVVVPNKGNLTEELAKNEIKYTIVPYEKSIYKDSYSFEQYVRYFHTNIKGIAGICKIIKEEHIDIVHSNSLAVDVGAIAAYITKVPHIWHFREYVKEDFDFEFKMPRLNKALIKRSRCCIAISKGIKKKYEHEYRRKCIGLYNALNSGLYYESIGEQEKRLSGELLMAGTICEGKGQWDAIRAVEILVKRGRKVKLNIIGNGAADYVIQMKKYIKKNGLSEIIFIQEYRNDLQELRRKSAAVLVCSRMEAFGRVTAEAMLAGKIVIGANAGGTLELIGEKEERGYLYTFNHPEQLADKIGYVLEHAEEVYQKEKNAQEFIFRLTDVEKYTNRLVRIYQKVLKS